MIMKPSRILIITNTIDAGGAETFLMKVFRTIDRSRFVFDFLINKKNSTFYLDEIHALGGRVYYGESKSRNPIRSFLCINKLVKQNDYKTVFCIAVHPIGFIDLLAAKMGGANKLLIRSTNSNAGGSISNFLAELSRPFVRMLADAMFAPSKEAACWLFGKNAVENNRVVILHNGVDTSLFTFSESRRKDAREKLGVENATLVIGHIGRFNRQKNHTKLIDVFCSIKSMNGNSKLVLVGEGELIDEVRHYVYEKHLTHDVLFLGIRKDISDLLCAFDVMVFPSLYEGMPNTIIEAQATDLPCVISDTISPDVAITNRVKQLPLSSNDEIWAEYVIRSHSSQRMDKSSDIDKAGYSIQSTTKLLSNYFL